MQPLNRIPEERRIITPLPLGELLLLSVLVRCLPTSRYIPSLVLNPQIDSHADAEYSTH